MGWLTDLLGSAPEKTSAEFAETAGGILGMVQGLRKKQQLQEALSLAKALYSDPSFNVSDPSQAQALDERHQAMLGRLLSYPPDVIQKVQDVIGIIRTIEGKSVSPAVAQRLRQLTEIDPTAHSAKQQASGALLGAMAADPRWAQGNLDILRAAGDLASKLGPDLREVSPGAGIYNPVTKEIEAIVDDPGKLYRNVGPGETLYDLRTGTPVYTNPTERTEPREEWSGPEQIKGLPGVFQRSTRGKISSVDTGEQQLNLAKQAILAGHGVTEMTGLDPTESYRVMNELARAEKLILQGMSPFEAARRAMAESPAPKELADQLPAKSSGLLGKLMPKSTTDVVPTLRQQLRQGVPWRELKEILVNKGWSEEEALKALKEAASGME